jgi:lysophospholipase L1-like esterase
LSADHSSRSTLLTLGLFVTTCAVLAIAPLPMWAKPFDLRSRDDFDKVAKRVFQKPRMTLAHVEEKLAAGGTDGRDAPEGAGIDATQAAPLDPEERELLATRDATADVVALQDAPPVPAPEEVKRPVIKVDRAAVIAKVKSPKADHFRAQAAGVKAMGQALTDPANLQPFFATLDAIAAGDESARAGVVILGNSLIASDHVTDVVRARLVERFGDAGRGFLLPERLSKVAGRRVRTGEGTAGWHIETFVQDELPPGAPKPGPFGFTGSVHTSTTDNERTVWKLEGASRARLFYLEHIAQPAMRLEVRNATAKGEPKSEPKTIARIEPLSLEAKAKSPAPRDESLEVEIPEGAHELILVAEGKNARVYGVALEKDKAGVVVDTIGVPAASSKLYVDSVDVDMFGRQLAQREPSLFVAMLGGNEVRSFNYGTLDPAKFDGYLTELLRRAKKAAPNSACLIVTPIDAVKATAAGEELTTRPEIRRVIEVQRTVAKREGCALFDLFAAMGGAGSLARFRDKGFLSDDLVHPTWRGGDVLGQLFADALLDAYAKTPPPDEQIAVARRKGGRVKAPVYAGLSFPAEERPVVVVKGDAPASDSAEARQRKALAHFFERLHALEKGEATRVAIGQLGASHTAGQMWTDRMRQRLADRFGHMGRGFVSVGRSSKRLEQGGVLRALKGGFEIADGREVVLGGAVGMSGTKVRMEPGSYFEITFGLEGVSDDDEDSKAGARIEPKFGERGEERAPGYLQLAWLYTPDMGTAEVAVDGKTVARISPDQRRIDSDVQFLRLPVDGAVASLSVHVPDANKRRSKDIEKTEGGEEGANGSDELVGPVHLLSVVEERERPGIVLDAVGLPGTTGMTPQRWRQDLVAAEVAAREYDLVVTAWGTNEAGIGSLDEHTYRHHFERTLATLMEASPGADCLIIGASDRLDDRAGSGAWKSAPAHDLVEKVQKQVAADRGCAFFSLRRAMGGAGSMQKWVRDGLGNKDHVHFTREGYEKLADLVINDLLAAYAYDAALAAAEAEAALARDSNGAPGNSDVDRRGG